MTASLWACGRWILSYGNSRFGPQFYNSLWLGRVSVYYSNKRWMEELNFSPLCHKLAYAPQTVVERHKPLVLINAYYLGQYRLYCEWINQILKDMRCSCRRLSHRVKPITAGLTAVWLGHKQLVTLVTEEMSNPTCFCFGCLKKIKQIKLPTARLLTSM